MRCQRCGIQLCGVSGAAFSYAVSGCGIQLCGVRVRHSAMRCQGAAWYIRHGVLCYRGDEVSGAGVALVFCCFSLFGRVLFLYRGVEQLVARRAHNPEAGGSSPPPATKNRQVSTATCRFYFFTFHSSLFTKIFLSIFGSNK